MAPTNCSIRDLKSPLRNDQRVLGIVPQSAQLTDEQKAKLERKIEEAKQSSTLSDHHHPELGGRYSKPEVVTCATPTQPWPKTPGYWAWADMGQSPSFNQQLTEFGVSQTSVSEKKR
jgi:hypothetical protein